MARNDAARREQNASLKPGDVWAEKERWLSIVLQAQQQMTCRGIDKPAGLPPGTLVLSHYMLVSGFVKWLVQYKICRGSQWIVIGGFVTEYLPDDDQPLRAMRPVETHGKTVLVNKKVTGQLARPVRVLVDAQGLPVPVPPEVWNAMGLA